VEEPNVKPAITEEGARRLFTWTSSQLEHKSSEEEKAEQETKLYQAARGRFPPADAQISSFQSWEEVGRWYGGLQEERVKPTPEIRAKATEFVVKNYPRVAGAATFLGRISPMRRIWAPTPRSFSSMFS
jgi:hypothetical protein